MENDAFLPVYLIALIIFTLSSNVIIITTFYKVEAMKVFVFEKVLCVIGLVASVCVQTNMLVVIAVQHSLHNHVFCEISGLLIALLQRAAIFTLCGLNVERYYNVMFPMKILPLAVARYATLACLVLAVTFALVPSFIHINNKYDVLYLPLGAVPLCIPLYSNSVKIFLYVDLVASFLIPTSVIFGVTFGMSKEVLKLSTSRIHPIKYSSRALRRISAGKCRPYKHSKSTGNTSIVNAKKFSRVSMKIRRKVAKHRKRIPKAFVVLPLTLFLVIILNLPTVIVMLKSKTEEDESTIFTDSWLMEYLCCLGIATTYLIYPVVNGLTNRELRNNALRVLRNKINNNRSFESEARNNVMPKVEINTVSSVRRFRVRIVEVEAEEQQIISAANPCSSNNQTGFVSRERTFKTSNFRANNTENIEKRKFVKLPENFKDDDPFYIPEVISL